MPNMLVILLFNIGIVVYTLFSSLSAFSQNLHVFSIIQTSDSNRPDRVLDADRLNEMSIEIASIVGFTRYYYDFGETTTFSPSYIRKTLQKVRFAPCNQDVVWLHYSGYGRNDYETIYPALQFGEIEMYLRDIIGILNQKKPKIMLLTIDSGNEKSNVKEFSNQKTDMVKTTIEKNLPIERTIKPLISNPIPQKITNYHKIENYNRLFKDFEGTKVLIFMSNSEGENALSNAIDGAYGLKCFEKALQEATNSNEKEASWVSIKEEYVRNVKNKTRNRQTPKVTIEVPLDKCNEND